MKNFALRHNSEGTVIETSSATTDLLPYGTIGSFTIDFTALPAPRDVPPEERTRYGEDERYMFCLQTATKYSDTRASHVVVQEYGSAVFKIVCVLDDGVVDGNYANYIDIGYFSPKKREVFDTAYILSNWWYTSLTSAEWQLRLELIANAISSMLPELVVNAEYGEEYPELVREAYLKRNTNYGRFIYIYSNGSRR